MLRVEILGVRASLSIIITYEDLLQGAAKSEAFYLPYPGTYASRQNAGLRDRS
jgi:hypothetical protein